MSVHNYVQMTDLRLTHPCRSSTKVRTLIRYQPKILPKTDLSSKPKTPAPQPASDNQLPMVLGYVFDEKKELPGLATKLLPTDADHTNNVLIWQALSRKVSGIRKARIIDKFEQTQKDSEQPLVLYIAYNWVPEGLEKAKNENAIHDLKTVLGRTDEPKWHVFWSKG